MDQKLAEFRRQIDSIDDQLMALLNQRASLVAQVFAWKASAAVPKFDEKREGEILSRARKKAAIPLSGDAAERVFRVILEVTKPQS